MLKTGCWTLTVWTAMNLLVSVKIIIDTLFSGGHTPALYLLLSEADVDELNADTIATLDSIAVFANGLNIAFCALALYVIWLGLLRRHRWCFPGVTIGLISAWCAGTAADFVVGNAAVWVSAISFMIIAAGLTFVALGLFVIPRQTLKLGQ